MDVTGSVDTQSPKETNRVVKKFYENVYGTANFYRVESVLADITDLFHGRYPGYQKCDTVYHDLEHTLQAYLAMARIFDGLIMEYPEKTSEEFVMLGLIATLGHDTGFIKENDDLSGSGGKYTLVHVERSKEFTGLYMLERDFSQAEVQRVRNMISCTGLWADLAKIPFASEEEKEAGYILGTADYLGQMSDPDYVEKLPDLYEEYKQGGFLEYACAEDLIEKTPSFFEQFVMKRLEDDYNSVYQFAANHFGGDNLYIEGIERNMTRIKSRFMSEI